MKKRGIAVIVLLLLVSVFSFSALAEEKDCVYYFYGQDCAHCKTVDTFFNTLQQKHPSLNITKFEIYRNKANVNLLQQYFNNYEVPAIKQGIPAVFLSKSYFIGSASITSFLEKAIISNQDAACPTLQKGEVIGVIGAKSPKYLIQTVTFGRVTGAAILDGLKTLAALLTLIIILLLIQNGKKALISGISFLVGSYLAYFTYGLSWLSPVTKGIVFSKIVGILAILASLGIIWMIQKRIAFEKKVEKALHKNIFPGITLIIGFVTSLFFLARLGKVFSILIDLAADKATKTAAIGWLLYHSLIIILPLLIVTIAFYFIWEKINTPQQHKGDQQVARTKYHHIKVVELITAIALIVLGLITVIFV